MQLFYRTYGNAGQMAIIVIHGVLGVSDNWDNFGKMFAELGFFVIIPDMRNHGQSPHSDVFNYHVMADDVKQILDKEKIEKCILIGHSMGGKVAMCLAFEFPEMVERLEILDISPRQMENLTEHVGFIESMWRVDLGKAERRCDVEAELAKDNYERRILLFLMKNLSYSHENGFSWKPNLDAIYKNINEIGVGFDSQRRYFGPTLFIKGGKSNYILEKDMDCIENHFPNYKMVVLPDSGHWIHVDSPDEFMEETRKFLME